jgi:hypothetical protein
MDGSRSARIGRLLLVVALAAMGLSSAARVRMYDPVPWEWLAAFAVGTALVAGPVTWLLRARLSEKRRETLGYVAAGLAILCLPVLLWFGLVFGNLILVMDAAVLGGVVGLAAVAIAERTVVPPRLRRTER